MANHSLRRLPWQGIQVHTTSRLDKIKQVAFTAFPTAAFPLSGMIAVVIPNASLWIVNASQAAH